LHVTPTFCDPAVIVNRKGPGKLDEWIVYLVATACLITFVAVTVGVDLVLGQLDRAIDHGWLPLGLTFVVAFWILASWLPPARLSRALRVAVLLPGVHALVIALAWPAWNAVSGFVSDRSAASVLVTEFPIAIVVLATLAVFAAFSLLVARRRSGEWLHGFVMLALTDLLLLGLWLPLSCAIGLGLDGEWWTHRDPVVGDVAARVLLTAAPPALVAMAFTAVALRWPARVLEQRRLILSIVLALFTLALIGRLDPSPRELLLYSNLVPMLLAAMAVAIAALIIFGAALAWRSYRMQRTFKTNRRIDGVIIPDDDAPAAGFEITSWLRGPRIVQRAFAVSTSAGTIPVSGAHLVATLPAATTQLQVGERIAVLRPGDRVTIAGHANAAGDPFRTSAAPLAGELFIAPAERTPAGFAQVALAMWRPSVAYLLIVVAIGLPALIALGAT
jgi:hypothetical protein